MDDNQPCYDSVDEAIAHADAILPGIAAPDGKHDPRWQAILQVGEFIQTNPDRVWEFAVRWGAFPCNDLQSAIVCCLVEHLLEHHFDVIFPRIRDLVCRDNRYDYWVRWDGLWLHGQAELPHNARQLARLERWSRAREERRIHARRRQREMWHDSQSWRGRTQLDFSPEGATNRSPRRKPGVKTNREHQPRRGDRT